MVHEGAKGKPVYNVLLCVCSVQDFSSILLCLILINELRCRDHSLVNSMEKCFWRYYYLSSTVLGIKY